MFYTHCQVPLGRHHWYLTFEHLPEFHTVLPKKKKKYNNVAKKKRKENELSSIKYAFAVSA